MWKPKSLQIYHILLKITHKKETSMLFTNPIPKNHIKLMIYNATLWYSILKPIKTGCQSNFAVSFWFMGGVFCLF